MRSLFVTGTDTGVGKTLVACALVHAFKMQGLKVAAMKPVASGSERTALGLRNGDAVALQQAANVSADYAAVNPYCFEAAIAPHLAARQLGLAIELPRLIHCYQQLAANADMIVVEGAGGWRVPREPHGYLSDFPEALQLDVVLVVGLRLGCLNHALLTAEAIERAGKCRLIGWIGNVIDPEFAPLEANLETLRERLPVPDCGLIQYQSRPKAEPAASSLDIERLGKAQQLGNLS